MKKYNEYLTEKKMLDYVDKLVDITTPEYMGDEDSNDLINQAEKEHGKKFADDLRNGLDKFHYPRKNQSGGYDKLANRKSGSVTKAGKLNKNSITKLKNLIKRGY